MMVAHVKYKKTGLDWMPEVPEHWEVKRLGGLFEERNETVSENDYAPLSVTMKGIVPQLESAAKTLHVDNRKKVCIGDFAINSRSDRRGSGGLSNFEGSVSIVNTVLKPSKFYVPEYTHYLLTNKLFQDEYYAKGKGIVADMWSTRFSEMKTIYLPVPTKDEQDSIVQYIKGQEEKINRFIEKKQRFIELLKEQRQRIINHSVTKGINLNAEMKNTGIDWLGEVPKHWQLRRLKNVAEVVLGKMLCNEDKGGYALKPYLKSKNIGWDKVIIEEVDEMWFSPKEMLTYRVKENDLLVSEGGEVGKTCIWKNELDECYIQNSVHKLTCFEDCLPEFYLFWMGMLGSVGYFKSIVNQVSIAHLTREKIVTVICLYPPLEEQKQIVSHIKTETSTIDTAIAKAEREIELIREYKEAMVSEAVMGKRK